MEAAHKFIDPKPHNGEITPDFNESEAGDELRPTLKLSFNGHTFKFALDAAKRTCTFETMYINDGDEVAQDETDRLQKAATKRAEERTQELHQQLIEDFA